MHLSIRWKFILSIGITLVVTYLGLLSWDYWWQKQTASEQMQQIVSELAQSRANTLNERFSSEELMTSNVAGVFERNPPTSLDQLTAAWNRANPGLQPGATVLIVMDPDVAASAKIAETYQATLIEPGRGFRGGRGGRGGAFDGQRGGPPRNLGGYIVQAMGIPQLRPVSVFDRTDPAYARAAEERKPVWCDPHEIRNFSPSATYSVPILAGDKLIGVVITLANTNLMRPEGGPRGRGQAGPGGPPPRGELTVVGPPPNGPPPGEQFSAAPSTEPTTMPHLLPNGAIREFTLIGSSGKIISPPPAPNQTAMPSLVDWAKSNGQNGLADSLQAALEGENSTTRVYRVQNAPGVVPESQAGENYWVAFAPIPATGWVVTAGISESQFMDPIISRLRDRALFLIGGLAVLLAVTTFVSIRVSRPIERMALAVNQLAAGDLDARVYGVRGEDEIGQLARAFNTMTGQLKTHVAELTKATAARENVEAELRIARQIQTDLLPRTFPPFPDRREFELHAVNLAAKRVAGDFFDFFFAPGDLLTIVIADVSGKGMPAALLMAVTRTIVRNLAMEGLSPAQIIERANAMLVQDLSDSMFVSLFLCQYDTHSGRVIYVNAGHPPPYRIAPDGSTHVFGEVTGAILGVNPTSEAWSFSQREDQLRPGETLLLYTDGVTEARAPDGSMFRNSGLEQLLTKFHDETVEGLCARIVDEVNRYQNGQPIDDVTLVALRRQA